MLTIVLCVCNYNSQPTTILASRILTVILDLLCEHQAWKISNDGALLHHRRFPNRNKGALRSLRHKPRQHCFYPYITLALPPQQSMNAFLCVLSTLQLPNKQSSSMRWALLRAMILQRSFLLTYAQRSPCVCATILSFCPMINDHTIDTLAAER